MDGSVDFDRYQVPSRIYRLSSCTHRNESLVVFDSEVSSGEYLVAVGQIEYKATEQTCLILDYLCPCLFCLEKFVGVLHKIKCLNFLTSLTIVTR